VKITIIFPARELETTAATASVMPLAPTLLAALTPDHHEVSLVDMFMGDEVDYESDADVVAITVRTPLAVTAYEIADRFLAQGKKVILGGPHTFALAQEAKGHATAVAIGEGEELWPMILQDIEQGKTRDFYVSGPYATDQLSGDVCHIKKRPDLAELPMMRRDLLPKERYFMDSIFTTRGCPNHCRFCPVTDIFGGQIRHRPIDEVVAEVDTLQRFYFNVDDSVFGHPQIVDRPQVRGACQPSITPTGGKFWSWRQRAASATSPLVWNRSQPRARSSPERGGSSTVDRRRPSILRQ
jgi:hypothetical protein